MPAALHEYNLVLDEHRRRLNRLLDRRGVGRMKRLYDNAQAELARKLERVAGPARNTFTAQQHRLVMAQVRQGQQVIGMRLSDELGDLTHEAQVESLHGLARDLNRLETKFTGMRPVLPIEDAARFAGVVGQHSTKLRDMHDAGMRRYTRRVIGDVEDQLAQSLILQESNVEAIDRVQKVADVNWWQGERIVRTETAFASNATYHDGLVASQEVLPDLGMRWCEHVDDVTGAPFDDRVGEDSIALHGQVADVGGLFYMPPGDWAPSLVTAGAAGWSHPPNRPNDRAVLSPFRSTWGIPGWRLSGGRRVPIRVAASR